MNRALLALAFGGFGLGLTEFVMMGILPEVANNLGLSIARAGHFISAYALGVGVGAPLLILSLRRRPPRQILLGLMTLFTLANLLTAFADGYAAMVLSRFIAGLPHGAFFGVGAVVASRLAEPGKGAQAVAMILGGLAAANLIGVPLGTWLSQLLSWHYTFMLVGGWGLFTLAMTSLWLPRLAAQPDSGLRAQLAFLQSPIPWLLLLVTILGNSGLFAWFSYVSPLLVEFSGFSSHSLSGLMVIAGLGMCVGNLLSGRLADQFGPERTATLLLVGLTLSLLLVFALSQYKPLAVLLAFTTPALAFALSTPMQVLLIKHAPNGQMLGAAASQVAFNLGNAMGAYVGGMPVAHGLAFVYPSLIGAGFAIGGFLVMSYCNRRVRHWPAAAC
ncbi:MFS transporter [Zobellella endophytica]|uniref:MFS transporter n=1 Tax=Zobellella endophytica TaxID=2116700 RepID=A0A2P7RCG2_9GAMM|nr:MFS transporter [Zobellella endophytica]PSJ47928.1 MFS transporter [Zobellella endophytica]